MITKEEYKKILDELSAERYRVARTKLELQNHRAALYLKIKRYPQNFGLEKATENSIEAVINLDEKTIELEHELLEATDGLNLTYAKYDLVKFEIDTQRSVGFGG
jgi:hypothetical protein